jgi:phage terminase small subunit
MDTLNQKHRLFVEAYDGNVVDAMTIAGYTGTPSYLEQKGNEFLKNPLISNAIKERSKYKAKLLNTIADREERQALWTDVMRNKDPHAIPETDQYGAPKKPENIPLATRLKASELLGKSEQDFVDTLNIQGQLTITDVISKSYKLKHQDQNEPTIEEIEAEYYRAQANNELLPEVTTPHDTTIDDLI